MSEKMIAKIIKTPGRYAIEVGKNLSVKVTDMNTYYTFEVDNENNIVGVKKNGKTMEKVEVSDPKHKIRAPETDTGSLPGKLDAGCISLGALVKDQNDVCIWKGDHWW